MFLAANQIFMLAASGLKLEYVPPKRLYVPKRVHVALQPRSRMSTFSQLRESQSRIDIRLRQTTLDTLGPVFIDAPMKSDGCRPVNQPYYKRKSSSKTLCNK